jgi:adenine-specific DNA-methyltransferase
MAKSANGKYQGSLSLEWFNKQKAVLLLDENDPKKDGDVPAPRINWINRDDALFYEIDEEQGKGLSPYWVDLSDIRVKEARPLMFKKAYIAEARDKKGSLPSIDVEYKVTESKVDDPSIQNLLIKGDNLLALNALKRYFDKLPDEDRVKCAYIDPPYNVDAALEFYDDNFAHSEWLTLIRDRLTRLHSLLREDGVLLVSIDDEELPYLRVLLDEIFGRENHLVTFVWKTDGNFDNQAKIKVNHEYIVAYCRDASQFSHPNVNDPNVPADSKIFRDEVRNTIVKNGPKNPAETIVLPKGFPARLKDGTIKKRNTSWPHYSADAVIKNNALVNEVSVYSGWSSRSLVEDFIRRGFAPIKDTKNQSTRFEITETGAIESVKERDKSLGYVVSILEKMGNTQSTSSKLSDNGISFPFPKPPFLISYLLRIFSSEGDVVMDCFCGSGTTPDVAHRINRRWVGVEMGKHADSHIIPRLVGTMRGNTIGEVYSESEWKGGGAFKYYHLGPSIIHIDKKTGKGEFNWKLGREFIQGSLLQSYDFVPDQSIKFRNDLAGDLPAIGRLETKKGVIFGVAWLVAPDEQTVSIDAATVQALYNTLKQHSPKSIHVFTNKGWDVKQDAMPENMEIIKVPHAIFAELER